MTAPTNDPDIPDPYSPKLRNQATARKFVAQNGRGYLALGIFNAAGDPVDAAANSVKLKVYLDDLSGIATDPRGVLVINVDDHSGSDVIVRDDVGKYHYDIGPAHTATRGLLQAEWTYEVDDTDFSFIDNMQILEQMPNYERLTDQAKLLVEQSSWYFADLFDSTAGGPWLFENFQTHFNYERISFLLGQAVMKLNVTGFPVTSYGITRDDPAIPGNFNALTIWATKLEVIRHLIASYTEIPDFPGTTGTYTNRRDYAERWRAVLDEEKPEFTQAVKMAKRGLLKLGRGSLIVGGGIFGGTASGFFMSGMYAAQTRSMRFYPAAPSVMWASQAFGRG